MKIKIDRLAALQTALRALPDATAKNVLPRVGASGWSRSTRAICAPASVSPPG